VEDEALVSLFLTLPDDVPMTSDTQLGVERVLTDAVAVYDADSPTNQPAAPSSDERQITGGG